MTDVALILQRYEELPHLVPHPEEQPTPWLDELYQERRLHRKTLLQRLWHLVIPE